MTSGVPSSRLASTRSGRSGSGCAITWLEMSTSCGTGSPANGPLSGNGRSRRGAPQDMAPPIDRPPARSRTGSSGSSSSCPDARLRQPRPGEADEEAPLLHPGDELRPLRLAERPDVGEDQHVGRRVQHLAERRLDHLGEGLERLPQVVQRIDQILPLAARPPRHHPDLAPPHRIVRQHHPRRRAPVGELHPRHPVAELDRQVDGEVEHVLARRRTRRWPTRAPARSRSDPARAPRSPPGAPRRFRPQHPHPELALLEPRRGQRQRGLRRPHHRHRPVVEQRPRQLRLAAMADPVLEPERLERVRPRRDPRPPRPPGPAPRPRARAPPAARATRLRSATAAPRRPAAARAMLTTAACRPVRAASSSAAAARSIRRLQSGASPQPPSIEHQERIPRPRRPRVQDRPGEGEDRRRQRQHPQQQAATRASAPASSPGRAGPRSSRTPGKARRPGAGGTARSSHQSTGSATNPRRSHGDRKATDPIIARSRPLAHRHVEPEQRLRAAARWCGGSTTASRDAARTR